MLKELSKSDWLSILGIPKNRIPSVLILHGTRNLKTKYTKYKNLFDNILEVGSPNGVLEDVLIGDIKGFPVGYASVYGAPMASEVAHVFGVLGTSLVIQTGCCGALGDGIAVGDLICATTAYCGEGASQYYLREIEHVDASTDMVGKIKCKKFHGNIQIHTGPIYTTSALFAEGKKEIENWYRKGYIGVGMETATTFAVAKYFRMKRLSILFVYDNPMEGSHILMEDSEKNKRRIHGESEMIKLALNMAVEYAKNNSR